MLFNFSFQDETAVSEFAADLALALKCSDFVALHGDLGAGKSTLARAIIRTLADDETLEVPSPTFTLVQHYEMIRFNVTHGDLYRVAEPQEVEELGLAELLNEGILLLEWPQKALDVLPPPTFSLTIEHEGAAHFSQKWESVFRQGIRQGENARWVTIEATQEASARLTRSLEIRAFLNEKGRKGAKRRYFTGDASARQYEKIWGYGAKTCEILMDAPAMEMPEQYRGKNCDKTKKSEEKNQIRPYARAVHLAQNLAQFVGIGRLIAEAGFIVPQMFAADLDKGLLLTDYFGDEGMLDENRIPIEERYLAAAEFLADFHRVNWPTSKVFDDFTLTIPPYDVDVMQHEVALFLDWYLPYKGITPDTARRQRYHALWADLLAQLAEAPETLVLRDYHSPNLFWRAGHTGHQRLGLIDFQDALIGPFSYDLASLAQDARVTISRALETAIIDAYCTARQTQAPDFNGEDFRRFYAITAAQRIAKILGIFVRLNERDGKPHYLNHLPRLCDYFERSLAHPALSDLATFMREILP